MASTLDDSQADPEPIYSLSRGCLSLLDDLIDNPSEDVRAAPDQLEELRAQFRQWSAYVGAFAAPKTSLDARLAPHSQIRDIVLDLLNMVYRNLDWARKTNNESSSGESFVGLEAAQSAVDRLLVLGVTIRRSARGRQSLVRSESSDNLDSYCLLLLKKKYPHARTSLLSQLANSIRARGTSLAYQQSHNRKLAYPRQEPTASDETQRAPTSDSPKVAGATPITRYLSPSHPDTDPSVISPSAVLRQYAGPGGFSKPTASAVSVGSVVEDAASPESQYPKRPKTENGINWAPCFMCHEPLQVSRMTEDQWRFHVQRDLEPYVCISEECDEPIRFFHRSEHWLEHMQTVHSVSWSQKIHTRYWYCDIDHGESLLEFDRQDELLAHLKKEHVGRFSESQLLGRSRRQKRIVQRKSFVCPFCDCVPDDILEILRDRPWKRLALHIGQHLKTSAFFSLSHLTLDNEGQKDDADSSEMLCSQPHTKTSLSQGSMRGSFSNPKSSKRSSSLENQRGSSAKDDKDELRNTMLGEVSSESKFMLSADPKVSTTEGSWEFLPEKDFQEDWDRLSRRLGQTGTLPSENTGSHSPTKTRDPSRQNIDNLPKVEGLFRLEPVVANAVIEQARTEALHSMLPQTGRWVIQSDKFREWCDGSGERLLLIKGPPGTGKTMLVHEIIKKLTKEVTRDRDVMYFFCSHIDARLNSARAVLQGLAYQLSQQRPVHTKVSGRNPLDIIFSGRNSWEEKCQQFLHILEDEHLTDSFIIIDGVDECSKEQSKLLWLIGQLSSTSVRTLVSFRNEPSIQAYLGQFRTMMFSSTTPEASLDFERYLESRVMQLALMKGYGEKEKKVVRRKLLSRFKCVFLGVHLFCEELERQEKDAEGLALVLDTATSNLKALYHHWLRRILDSATEAERVRLIQLLSTLALSFRPLGLSELGSYLEEQVSTIDTSHATEELVSSCKPLLTIVDQTVAFAHQSVRDFLATGCSGEPSALLPCHLSVDHATITSASLHTMSVILRRNVYKLPSLGTVADKIRAPLPDPLKSVRYACVYWIDHFISCRDSDIEATVCKFLQVHLLHWLEALSLMRCISDAFMSLSRLADAYKNSPQSELKKIAVDALNFIRYNGLAIEYMPLQAYGSALIFSPQRSIMKHLHWFERTALISNVSRVEENWGNFIHSLEGHTGGVTSVSFSKDGNLIASASADHTARLWNARTGQYLEALEGHTDSVNAVTFSPDSSLLATASDDLTVQIWGVKNSDNPLVLCTHQYGIKSVVFSPDGKKVASGSRGNTVEIWNLGTQRRETTLVPVPFYHGSIVSLAFHPDGGHIAAASLRCETVWEIDTESIVWSQISEGFDDTMSWTSVSFSPDGKSVACGSANGFIGVTEWMTSRELWTAKICDESVESIAFSPDGKLIALASADGTVRLLNASSGVHLRSLDGHLKRATSVSFSPDAKVLASASGDTSVIIWDVTMHYNQFGINAHLKEVSMLCFSPNGRMVASASEDQVIKLWNVGSGDCLQKWEGNVGSIAFLEFSSDGESIDANFDFKHGDDQRGSSAFKAHEVHLNAEDANVGYCLTCCNEWYQDEYGLQCPDCQSMATKTIKTHEKIGEM